MVCNVCFWAKYRQLKRFKQYFPLFFLYLPSILHNIYALFGITVGFIVLNFYV